MIVVDTEFTSLDFNNAGLWQIGAVDLDAPENTFLEEARLEEEDEVEEAALKVVEKTEEELRNLPQSQKEMLEHFFKWAEKTKIKNLICQGQWDFGILLSKAYKFGLNFPFHHRAFDLHSIAQMKHMEIKGEFSIDKDHSGMGLYYVLEFCGIEDERRIISIGGQVEKQGKPHNALEDAKLEAECFSRLIYGKNLLPEFAKFKIPEYLKKEDDNLQ